jgi:Rps23 Pro-64 3,4-dihydroxylase Tpa1-like proline 4-hydroxylase
MAFQTIWYETSLPKNIIETMEEDLKVFDDKTQDSSVGLGVNGEVDKSIRNSKNIWIPTSHWVGGFLWHYAMRANRENFLYDLTCVDAENLQYTQYGEGQYYNWHIDAGIDVCHKPQIITSSATNLAQDQITVNGEYVRKLSFTLQLSDPEDYRGGEVQFMDPCGKSYFMPKQRGTIAFFDSRASHRVRKVKSGMRKSIVGWVVGPRWK